MASFKWARAEESSPQTQIMVWGKSGCVSGDTQVNINRGGKGWTAPIRHVVKMANGGTANGMRWDPQIPTMVRGLKADGSIGLIELDIAWEAGVKVTYAMTLADGRTVRSTDEHRFWTPDGWLRHDQIRPGTMVGVQSDRPTERKLRDRSGDRLYQHRCGLLHHPYAKGRTMPAGGHRVLLHRLVMEAHLNRLDLDDFLDRLRTGRDLAGLGFLRPDQVVHHENGNATDNAIANLVVTDGVKHGQAHGSANRRNFGDTECRWVPVAESMADPFEEETYDFTMDEGAPSYLANGIVSHNTGKTGALVRAAADMDTPYAEIADRLVEPVGDDSVFLLTCERNALATARVVNPKCGTFLAETKREAGEVLKAAQAGELREMGFTRLAVDGLTELQRLIGDELNPDADGYWNTLIRRTDLMLRSLRGIPMHVTCSALEQQRENERTKVVEVGPQFGGRATPDTATSMMAASGRTTRTGEGLDERYVVDLSLPGRYLVKSVGQLRGRVKPCVAAWLEVLAGTRDVESIRYAVASEPDAMPIPVDAPATPKATKGISR